MGVADPWQRLPSRRHTRRLKCVEANSRLAQRPGQWAMKRLLCGRLGLFYIRGAVEFNDGLHVGDRLLCSRFDSLDFHLSFLSQLRIHVAFAKSANVRLISASS